MSNQISFSTPYPQVNSILQILLADIRSILGDQFIGMYLYGSLAYGGFDRDSDVDFVVVTRDQLPETMFLGLQSMHNRNAKLDFWCATQLEGSYIPLAALQEYDPVQVLHLHIDRGPGEQLQRMLIEDPVLSRAWWGGWVLLRAVLHEKGLPIAGPASQTLVEPVSAEDLKQATLAILLGWAAPILENPAEIAHSGYQSYTVLTLCRMLYTLENAAIASKPDAARRAQAGPGKLFAGLIERAWLGRHNPAALASPQEVKATQDFILFTMEYSQRFFPEMVPLAAVGEGVVISNFPNPDN